LIEQYDFTKGKEGIIAFGLDTLGGTASCFISYESIDVYKVTTKPIWTKPFQNVIPVITKVIW